MAKKKRAPRTPDGADAEAPPRARPSWETASWRAVDVGAADVLSGAAEGGFMELEELDPAEARLLLRSATADAAGDGADDAPGAEPPQPPQPAAPGKKEKKRKAAAAAAAAEGAEEVEDASPPQKKAKGKKPKGEGGARGEAEAQAEETAHEETAPEEADVSAWSDFELDPRLLKAIAVLGFREPTRVQRECLPFAVRSRKDVIGASETGSGKTLAFALPVLQRILQDREDGRTELDGHLRALVLCPTRELAMQVCTMFTAAARFAGVRVVALVGGIAVVKQKRLLGTRPEVVVATPGRLWELMSKSEPHLTNTDALHFLVLDEADRMVEKGHFEELNSILDTLPLPAAGAAPSSDRKAKHSKKSANPELVAQGAEQDVRDVEMAGADAGRPVVKRQTFVFSATLTVPEALRRRLRKPGAPRMKPGSGTAVSALMERVAFAGDPQVIDVTDKGSTHQMPATLEEAMLECTDKERDTLLYYLLSTHPGRTVVFCNAISALRRITALLRLLRLPVHPLHAEMQQRARLKAMDRFRSAEGDSILVATDVAARGLDISGVGTVVHYQVAPSAEIYVHRSGRTARAQQAGVSITLVAPADRARFTSLCRALGRNEAMPTFPLERSALPAAQKRVSVAVKLDSIQHRRTKERSTQSWAEKNAEEMGLALDEDYVPKGWQGHRELDVEQEAQQERTLIAQLDVLLSTPLGAKPRTKYPTRETDQAPPDAAPVREDALAAFRLKRSGQSKVAKLMRQTGKKQAKAKRKHKL